MGGGSRNLSALVWDVGGVGLEREWHPMRHRGADYAVEGVECARDRLLLLRADPRALDSWTAPQLPLKGGEIVERGMAKGRQVARTLQEVERRWVEEGFPERERVMAMLDNVLAAG